MANWRGLQNFGSPGHAGGFQSCNVSVANYPAERRRRGQRQNIRLLPDIGHLTAQNLLILLRVRRSLGTEASLIKAAVQWPSMKSRFGPDAHRPGTIAATRAPRPNLGHNCCLRLPAGPQSY